MELQTLLLAGCRFGSVNAPLKDPSYRESIINESHIKSILTDFFSPFFFLVDVIFKQAKIDQKYCIITLVSRDYGTVIDSDQPGTNHSFSCNFRYTVIWLRGSLRLHAINLLD